MQNTDKNLPIDLKKSTLFYKFIALFIFLILVFLTFVISDHNQKNKKLMERNTATPSINSNISKPDINKAEIKTKYIEIENENAVTFTTINSSGEEILKAHLFNVKFEDITVPFLLSNYDHILVINNYGAMGFTAAGAEMSEGLYGKSETFNTNVLRGKKYVNQDGTYSASLKILSDDKALSDTGFQINAKDENTFFELIKIAESYNISNNANYHNNSENILPRLSKKSATYWDPEYPYSYYLPSNFTPVKEPIEGYPNKYFESTEEETICLSYKEDRNDPCAFSTSGCTCCNTGCNILDYVVHSSRTGGIYIDPILQKGRGEGMGTRFVYDIPHPWLYYSAYYSSPTNSPEGVLELIYLLDSMERNY